MLDIADLGPEIQKELKDSIRYLKKLLDKDLYTREQGVEYYKDLVWVFMRNISLEELRPISYFLSFIGIYNIEGSIYEFRHQEYPIHVKITQKRNKLIINAHLDVVWHKHAEFTKFTSELLSELSKFLNNIATDSTTFLITESHSRELENVDVEPTETGTIEVADESEEEDAEIDISQIDLEERIEESRISINNALKDYQKKRKLLRKLRALRDQERRDRRKDREKRVEIIRQIQANRNLIFKNIIDIPFNKAEKKVTLKEQVIIDEEAVNRDIKNYFRRIFAILKSKYKGFFLIEFNAFYNEYYQERLLESRILLQSEELKRDIEKRPSIITVSGDYRIKSKDQGTYITKNSEKVSPVIDFIGQHFKIVIFLLLLIIVFIISHFITVST